MTTDATMATAPAATPMNHGIATIHFNGLTVDVGFDVHSELPPDQKEELVRLAALQCVTDFFAAYRAVDRVTNEGEAA